MKKAIKIFGIFLLSIAFGIVFQYIIEHGPGERSSEKYIYDFCGNYTTLHQDSACHVDPDLKLVNLADELSVEQSQNLCTTAVNIFRNSSLEAVDHFRNWKLNIHSYSILQSRPLVECKLDDAFIQN